MPSFSSPDHDVNSVPPFEQTGNGCRGSENIIFLISGGQHFVVAGLVNKAFIHNQVGLTVQKTSTGNSASSSRKG